MNEPAGHMKAETEKPKNYEGHEHDPKHIPSLFELRMAIKGPNRTAYTGELSEATHAARCMSLANLQRIRHFLP